jgi:Protein of unknown function (DUF1018)
MKANLLALDSSGEFEKFCKALLNKEFPRFQAFSAPDEGMDGFDSDSNTVFQMYFPERQPRKDKIEKDIAKARLIPGLKHWVLLIPKDPTPTFRRSILEQAQIRSCAFDIDIWGQTKIHELLARHPEVRNEYFSSELRDALRKLAKGKAPRQGDAALGTEITAEQATELKEWILKLADENSKRKRRKGSIVAEYSEFNARFNISSFGLLPATQFLTARKYLETKFYARRQGETRISQRNRFVSIIKTIQRALRIPDHEYRQTLYGLTGKSSTTDMSIEEVEKVAREFRSRQGRVSVRNLK